MVCQPYRQGVLCYTDGQVDVTACEGVPAFLGSGTCLRLPYTSFYCGADGRCSLNTKSIRLEPCE